MSIGLVRTGRNQTELHRKCASGSPPPLPFFFSCSVNKLALTLDGHSHSSPPPPPFFFVDVTRAHGSPPLALMDVAHTLLFFRSAPRCLCPCTGPCLDRFLKPFWIHYLSQIQIVYVGYLFPKLDCIYNQCSQIQSDWTYWSVTRPVQTGQKPDETI